jgi:hypothetical protein
MLPEGGWAHVRTIRQVVSLQRAFEADVMAAGSMRLRATSTKACGNRGASRLFRTRATIAACGHVA